jgi:hypothetical protein
MTKLGQLDKLERIKRRLECVIDDLFPRQGSAINEARAALECVVSLIFALKREMGV